MRNSMKKVHNLIKAKTECIWVDTYEENEALSDIKEIAIAQNMHLYLWSHTEGLKKVPLNKMEKQEPSNVKLAHPKALFAHISNLQSGGSDQPSLFILRDLHLLNETHEVKRALRDIKEYPSNNYCPIVAVSPVVNIPAEHEKLFTIVSYDVPSKEEVRSIVERMAVQIEGAVAKGKPYKTLEAQDKKFLTNAFLGLTLNEIYSVFAKSIVEYGELSVQAVMDEKIQLVKKSGVLDYVVPKFTFEDIGGNKAFKSWIEEIEDSFSEEAIAFGCHKPKGYLALGVPGSSKTAGAEALANKFGYPLIKLDMSKIMDKLVGQSERKIDQAFRVAKACSPCVLLMDEVEKMMGGVSSSNSSDSGTLARVFGKTLEFLNDDHDVFVIMTSNDVSQLPPELTRSGRLDAMWYFSIPTEEERKEIFRIHLGKTGKKVSDETISAAISASKNFTGAEIAETVKASVRKAYSRFKTDGVNEILEEDLISAANETIPLFQSSREKITYLENWSNGRARRANEAEKEEAISYSDKRLLGDILNLER